MPDRSLGILVGDSGLGKSPLVYQMGLCVTSGTPFLGRTVKKGRVLCLDFENGIGQVYDILDGLRRHLGLEAIPDDLVLWNLNDADEKYGTVGHSAKDIILQVEPRLTIVDALTGLYPTIEKDNPTATKYFQELRQVMRTCGTSILGLHHIKKPPSDSESELPLLEISSDVRPWFLQARGARALINGTDIRLGVVPAEAANIKLIGGKNNVEVALVLRGFGRVRGEIPALYLARHCDEEGEPLGYGVIRGVNLLFEEKQREALARLPQKFRFKEARQAYGRADQATADFLKKCMGLGLIRKIGKAG